MTSIEIVSTNMKCCSGPYLARSQAKCHIGHIGPDAVLHKQCGGWSLDGCESLQLWGCCKGIGFMNVLFGEAEGSQCSQSEKPGANRTQPSYASSSGHNLQASFFLRPRGGGGPPIQPGAGPGGGGRDPYPKNRAV